MTALPLVSLLLGSLAPGGAFAFSNNVKPRLAAPSFQQYKFMVAGPGQVVSITD